MKPLNLSRFLCPRLPIYMDGRAATLVSSVQTGVDLLLSGTVPRRPYAAPDYRGRVASPVAAKVRDDTAKARGFLSLLPGITSAGTV